MILKKILLLVLGLTMVFSLAGCMMGASSSPMDDATLDKLQADLEEIDALSDDVAVKLQKVDFESEASDLEEKDPEQVHLKFLSAYCAEKLGNYKDAIESYEPLKRSGYAAMANFRIGEVAAHAPDITDAHKVAVKGYSGASGYSPSGNILVRYPPLATEPLSEWKKEDLRIAANSRADKFNRDSFSYQAIDKIVGFLGRNPSYSYGLAIFVIALLVKVITTPLSSRQIKSMREMQAIQPLLNELQKKHKGDKEAMMREQMKLFKEHGINPLGGCLPLLIQLPFLIFVYRAVWAYNWQFEGTRFLWIGNLALPDTALLIMYAISLYFSQKLTTTPTADPQQQQMQRMMAIIFPVMFLFMFKFMPAAFILYWFAQNVLMTGHQYYILKKNPPPALAAKSADKVVKRK